MSDTVREYILERLERKWKLKECSNCESIFSARPDSTEGLLLAGDSFSLNNIPVCVDCVVEVMDRMSVSTYNMNLRALAKWAVRAGPIFKYDRTFRDKLPGFSAALENAEVS